MNWLTQERQHTLFLFDFILYVPVNNFSDMLDGVDRSKCAILLRTCSDVARLELSTLQSRVEHSTTEPLCSPRPDIQATFRELYTQRVDFHKVYSLSEKVGVAYEHEMPLAHAGNCIETSLFGHPMSLVSRSSIQIDEWNTNNALKATLTRRKVK